MIESFGGTAAEYKKQRDDERGDTDISIFEMNGKYYALNDDRYIECDDPKTCSDGLLAMRGKWQSFDDEEEPDMTHERKKVVEHEGVCQVCGSAAEYAILGKGDTLYRDIGSAICICKRCLTQDADMAWDKMETI
jgi:hypothetical protein